MMPLGKTRNFVIATESNFVFVSCEENQFTILESSVGKQYSDHDFAHFENWSERRSKKLSWSMLFQTHSREILM